MAAPWRRPSEWPPAAWAALAGLVGIAAYLGAVHGGPAVLDDIPAVVDNPVVNGRSPWTDAFETDFWGGGRSLGIWRPLVTLWYRLDFALGGGGTAWMHAVNVLLHGAVCAAGALAFAAVAPAWIAGVAALLFAVVAAPSEAVEALVGRADELFALFGLLGLIAHVRGRKWLAGGLLVLAFGCKEMAVALPVAWVLLGPKEGRAPRRLVPYAAAVAVAALFRWHALGYLRPPPVDLMRNPLQAAGPLARALGAGDVFARFILPGILDPSRRLYVCSAPACGVPPFSSPVAWLGLAGLLAVCAAPFILWRRSRLAAIGLAWFALLFIPVSNLLTGATTIYAERLLYAPIVGLCFGVAAVLASRARRVALPVLAAWALWNAAALQRRHGEWRDAPSLYLSALWVAPDSAHVQQNAAVAAYRLRDAAAAARHASRALELAPGYPEAQATLALALDRLGRAAESPALFEAALRASNFSLDIASDYARFLVRHGDRQTAADVLRRAQAAHPLRTMPPDLAGVLAAH